jgi:transposase
MEDWSKGEFLQELRKRDEVIAELRQANALLQQENALLRQKVELLVRRVFGKSSETMSPGQLDLFLLGENPPKKDDASWLEEAAVHHREQKPKVARGPRGKARWPEDLPVVEEVIEPEEVKANPADWRRIGEERTERLDYRPARFFRQVTVRPKYVERALPEAAPIIAELPPCLQERGTVAPGLLAQILVAKYCDHLPLYRQEQIYYSRHGVWLPRQNLAAWVELCAFWLQPIYELIKTGVFGGGYAQVDETPVKYLVPGLGKTDQGYLWTVCRPGHSVFFAWKTSRAAECLDKIIPVNFRGQLQCDGYSAYGAFANGRTGIELAACLAHIRREIFEAKDQDPRVAGFLLKHIQNLYRIERRLRRHRAGPALRQAVREAESRPIFLRLQKTLLTVKARYLPKSALGKAIAYALAQWPRMELWLRHGQIEIDNNLVENAIRPTALGKKNWLFFGDAEAGQRSAVIYTIIENCRLQRIDPYAYLRDVLTRLPAMTNHQIAELTPQAWAKRRAQSSPLAAAA